jgi:MFS family permease
MNDPQVSPPTNRGLAYARRAGHWSGKPVSLRWHGGFQASLEKSVAAELLPRANRGSGFGVLAATNGLGDLLSSVVVGALWTAVSPAAGFAYAAVFTAMGALVILVFRGSAEPKTQNSAR